VWEPAIGGAPAPHPAYMARTERDLHYGKDAGGADLARCSGRRRDRSLKSGLATFSGVVLGAGAGAVTGGLIGRGATGAVVGGVAAVWAAGAVGAALEEDMAQLMRSVIAKKPGLPPKVGSREGRQRARAVGCNGGPGACRRSGRSAGWRSWAAPVAGAPPIEAPCRAGQTRVGLGAPSRKGAATTAMYSRRSRHGAAREISPGAISVEGQRAGLRPWPR